MKFTGDLDAAEAAVREHYSDARCVVPAQHSKDELVAIENQLMSMSSIQVHVERALRHATGERLEMGIIAPAPERQAAFDEQYRPGVVRLTAGLRTV